jgi:hypothetical protein
MSRTTNAQPSCPQPTTGTRTAEAPRRVPTAARQRKWARAGHLVAGGLIGVFVYAPPAVAAPLQLLLQVVVVPTLTVTGLLLWKQAQIRRLIAPTRARRADRFTRP